MAEAAKLLDPEEVAAKLHPAGPFIQLFGRESFTEYILLAVLFAIYSVREAVLAIMHIADMFVED